MVVVAARNIKSCGILDGWGPRGNKFRLNNQINKRERKKKLLKVVGWTSLACNATDPQTDNEEVLKANILWTGNCRSTALLRERRQGAGKGPELFTH